MAEQSPIEDSKYKAPWWLPCRHLQTIAPLLAFRPRLAYDNSDARERWETPDGDFIDVDCFGPKDAPRLLVVFHGIEGSSQSAYTRAIGAHALASGGWRVAAPHFRGCSGTPNRKPRAYHAADSAEIDWILKRFRDSHDAVHAVGVSLGGNALLKWLAEQGDAAVPVVRRAVTISALIDLEAFGEVIGRGLNFLYGWFFLNFTPLRPKAMAKFRRFPKELEDLHVDEWRVYQARTLSDFDDAVTAPLHGFMDNHHYWRCGSSKGRLDKIRVPTLLINARNDPFHPGNKLPKRTDLGTSVEADFPTSGGHTAFPGCRNWLARRVVGFLSQP
jgi:uncharacterized protein